MTNATLRQALTCAARGWPVFPCLPGQKIPATKHGYLDATTNQDQITAWFSRQPDYNLAVATGTPGPDVLDVDQHGAAGNGFHAFSELLATGMLDGASTWIRTPRGGLHLYFIGSDQRNGHLAAHHLDFRSTGGYVLSPPSEVDGKPYKREQALAGRGQLDWQSVVRFLEPARQHQRAAPRQLHETSISRLAGWVATQPEGNRNEGLFWAANRALEADPAADLSPLAVAARQAGLGDPEITRTLDSARRTSSKAPDHQAEGAS
jgi:hypothetical protein